ncbi:hypothetical protein KO561_16620 [Radiobacillus kanasensis]|uniref:hypothetical protein n=1 Tax=Radiobacillus kanasensis TaxID=2844358 RepID=UPI001E54EE8F|nr:hypothetical protein [Radiobacillus kanasensis]UFT98799.1 hypothetical protein KO561_16620 [Radiobacillus kanasensis]
MKNSNNGMSLLEKRELSLRESHERTRKLYKQAEKLGLLEVYTDFKGNMKTKKDKN